MLRESKSLKKEVKIKFACYNDNEEEFLNESNCRNIK